MPNQPPGTTAPGLDGQSVAQPAPARLESLLPPNAKPTELNLESAAWRLGREGPEAIRGLWASGKISAEMLPWLAWAMAVDAWDARETEEMKRASVQGSIDLKRIKGTLESFRRLARLYGGELLRVERPPNQMFVSAPMTQAERDAFLSVYPQLRIRQYPEPAPRIPGSMYTRKSFLGNTYLAKSDALERWLPRAYYYDPATGRETRVATAESVVDFTQQTLQARIPARVPMATFAGRFLRYLPTSTAAERIYSVRVTHDPSYGTTAARWKTMHPGIEPINVFPEFVAQRGSGKHRLFTSGWFLCGYMPPSTAPWDLYNRIYLFDPTKPVTATKRSTYLGACRLGQPAYTAELVVSFPDKRPTIQFGRFMRGYLCQTDLTRLQNFMRSAAWTKSARDKVLLDTQTYFPLTAGAGIKAGQGIACGSQIRR